MRHKSYFFEINQQRFHRYLVFVIFVILNLKAMLKPKVLEAINNQINAEYYSAFLYLSMSAYFQDKGLPGFANCRRFY